MRSYVDRRDMIENLLSLVQKMELETEDSIRMETALLVAYSLTQIEQHLSEMKGAGGALKK